MQIIKISVLIFFIVGVAYPKELTDGARRKSFAQRRYRRYDYGYERRIRSMQSKNWKTEDSASRYSKVRLYNVPINKNINKAVGRIPARISRRNSRDQGVASNFSSKN